MDKRRSIEVSQVFSSKGHSGKERGEGGEETKEEKEGGGGVEGRGGKGGGGGGGEALQRVASSCSRVVSILRMVMLVGR